MQSGGLARRAASGAAVVVGAYGVSSAIRLTSNLILTRLVAPEAFSLMAIALTIYIWVGLISDVGLNTSIVRSDNGDDPRFISTAFVMQIVRGVALGAVIGAVALFFLLGGGDLFPPNLVYADDNLGPILLFVSLVATIDGFTSMKVSLAQRRLEMARLAPLELSTQFIGACSTLVFAYFGFGVYALVYGMVIGGVAKMIASHAFLPGPDLSLDFDRAHFREIFSFGKWIVLSSTFGFLAQRGDQLIFSGIMDKTEFSFYAIAGIWIMAARQVFGTLISRVAFPAIAEIGRDRPLDRSRAYYRLRLAFDFSIAAFVVATLALADIAFGVMYTEQYAAVAGYVKLLVVGVLLTPYNILNSVVLAEGRSREFTLVTFCQGATPLIGGPLLFHWIGLEAAILFVALSPLAVLPLMWFLAGKNMVIDMRREAPLAVFAVALAVALAAFA